MSIRDIGPVVAQAILDYLDNSMESITTLVQHLHPTIPFEGVSLIDSPLAGQSFCVTGSFSEVSRDDIHALIESNGGEVRSSVSAKLSYLIVGSNAGSKLERAKELGVKVLSLEDFEGMI
jgi:DNA ligase (NAD+)